VKNRFPIISARFGAIVLAAALLCGLSHSGVVEAVNLTAELTTGYDANPALSDPSDGSGFSTYALRAGQPFDLAEKLLLDLSVEGKYQQYWSVEDNYRLQTNGALSYVMADGRFIPMLMGEAAVYRDGLIEADERNEVMVGLGADWIISNRLNLGVAQTYRWLNYLNWALPFSGKGQGRRTADKGGGGKGRSSSLQSEGIWDARSPVLDAGKGKRPLDTLYPPRDNRLLSTSLDLDIFIAAPFTARVYAAYGDLDSSLEMESYRELDLGIALSWFPAPQWLAGVEATWSRMDYYQVPDHMTCVRNVNTIWSAALQISRFWRNFEFFGALGWKSGDAPLDYESYAQTVIQCGLSYSF